MYDLMRCPVCGQSVTMMDRGRKDNLFWTDCQCGYEGPSYTTREEAAIIHNDQCALIAQHLVPRAERDAARAELAALKKRIADGEFFLLSEDECKEALK